MQTYVEFVRKERFAGETKYPLKKMVKLAFDGITSFSYKSLVIAGYLGGLTFAAGLISLVTGILKDASNISIKRRIAYLAAGTAILLAVSFSWALIVDSIPAANRPYVGSSGNDTEMVLL